MRRIAIRILVAVLTFAIGVIGTMIWIVPRLQSANTNINSLSKVEAPPALPAEAAATPPPTPNSLIRAVDFANFTYPAKPIYSDGEKSFMLKDGRYKGRPGIVGASEPFGLPYPVSLVGIVYGDVADDGAEEAMVVLSENVAGTAIPYYVYIYGMKNNRPELLWALATGDRGDGGLRNIYAEKGGLILELYGKDTFIDDIDNKEEAGACCPKSFTRTPYRWNGKRFQKEGSPEVLPNPLQNAEMLVP